MKNKIHVIPHTHWDREWYFTSSHASVYLMKDLSDILSTLEEDKDFLYFVLDGQTSLLHDYLSWRPQDRERIKKLVKENRLIIGPWYTQSDLMLPSGECIIRNLYYGMKDCAEFGKHMNVAYVPDSFGQSANMPQIYKQFGIEDTVFWRGVSDEMVSKVNFTWIGDDGTPIFATQIPNGYYTAFSIPEDKADREHFWNQICIPSEAKRSATRNIYISNGFDQAPIRKNLSKLIAQRNQEDEKNEYCISNIEQYIKEAKKDIDNEHIFLESISGELLNAKQMRLHKTIYSSRADLKQMNTEIQNYLTHTLEPLMSISYSLGNAYPQKEMEYVWRLLLENSAHDSIGSCISDDANEDVYMRYKKAKEIAKSLVELHSRLISTHIKKDYPSFYTITLFNTRPYIFKECMRTKIYIPGEEFELRDAKHHRISYVIRNKKDVSDYVKEQCIQMNPSIKTHIPDKVYEVEMEIDSCDIPAMGYLQLYAIVGSSSQEVCVSTDCLENEFYTIEVNDNGTFEICDKQNGFVYHEQGVLIDCGEDGDSFNYSPPIHDMMINSLGAKAKIHMQSSNLSGEAIVEYTMKVPYDLEERSKGICSTKLPVKMELRLKKNSPLIDIKIEIDNQVLSHKMSIQFDNEIASTFNYADQQFGVIQRVNIYKKEMDSYDAYLKKDAIKKAGNVVNWDNNPNTWQEPMIPIEPTQSFVSICKEDRGVAVFPKGVREYEIVGEKDDTISITLFRTYGVMGRENLLYRPGRSSGERTILTPDAQLLKKMTFDLSVYYYQSDFNEASISRKAYECNTPAIAFGYGEFLNGRIIFAQEVVERNKPNQYSLMEKTGELIVSTVKKAEERDGYIIRLYNGLYKENASEQIIFKRKLMKAYVVNAKEEILAELPIENNSVYMKDIEHCKFVSLMVEIE